MADVLSASPPMPAPPSDGPTAGSSRGPGRSGWLRARDQCRGHRRHRHDQSRLQCRSVPWFEYVAQLHRRPRRGGDATVRFHGERPGRGLRRRTLRPPRTCRTRRTRSQTDSTDGTRRLCRAAPNARGRHDDGDGDGRWCRRRTRPARRRTSVPSDLSATAQIDAGSAAAAATATTAAATATATAAATATATAAAVADARGSTEGRALAPPLRSVQDVTPEAVAESPAVDEPAAGAPTSSGQPAHQPTPGSSVSPSAADGASRATVQAGDDGQLGEPASGVAAGGRNDREASLPSPSPVTRNGRFDQFGRCGRCDRHDEWGQGWPRARSRRWHGGCDHVDRVDRVDDVGQQRRTRSWRRCRAQVTDRPELATSGAQSSPDAGRTAAASNQRADVLSSSTAVGSVPAGATRLASADAAGPAPAGGDVQPQRADWLGRAPPPRPRRRPLPARPRRRCLTRC